MSAHTAFDQIKIVDTLGKRTVAQFYASAGRGVGQVRRWDLHISSNHMMKTEVLIDVGGCDLTGCYCTDDRSRTGYSIAAGKNMWCVGDKCIGLCLDLTAHDRRDLLKWFGIDRLPDRYNDDITGNAEPGLLRILGTGTAVRSVFADDLRTGPKCGYAAVFIGFNMVGRLQGQDLAAFALGIFDFFGQCGHIGHAAAVNTGDMLCAQTDGGTGCIH